MNLLEDIKEYWDERSESFSHYNNIELHDFKRNAYEEILLLNLGYGSDLAFKKGLDLGCGPGFFSIILALRNAKMTSIDYSHDMLKMAKANFKKYLQDSQLPEILRMDAENLKFKDETFDFIVCRNVTWILQNPCKAYKEWLRVLKPGGKIIIFDAQWYKYIYDKNVEKEIQKDKEILAKSGNQDFLDSNYYHKSTIMHDIAKDLFFTKIDRPQFDINFFQDLGLYVHVEYDISNKIFNDLEKILYRQTPMFLIKVIK